jgi:hypothetical protein
MAYVYRHIRLDKNQPFYIGIGSDQKYVRAYTKNGRNKYWVNITNISTYEVEILFDDLTWQEACAKEIEFIKLYGKNPNGPLCNITDGGDGALGIKMSPERKKRNSEIHKGKVVSEESRKKISKSHKGKILTIEHKRNISKGGKGRKFSEEHKKKIGKANKTINHGNWNGYIYQYNNQNNLINIFETLHQAKNTTGIDFRDISKVCSYYSHIENGTHYSYKKRHLSAGGFIWKKRKTKVDY